MIFMHARIHSFMQARASHTFKVNNPFFFPATNKYPGGIPSLTTTTTTNTHLIVCTTIKVGSRDDIVSDFSNVGDGKELSCLTRGSSDGMDTTLESGDSLFKSIGGGVHDTGVDVTEFLETEETGAMVGVFEDEGGRCVNGGCAGAGCCER